MIPPWLIIEAVVILVPVFIFMTIENINRQKKQTTRLLVEKGAALIRSFEAVARREVSGLARGCLIHPFSGDWSLSPCSRSFIPRTQNFGQGMHVFIPVPDTCRFTGLR